MPSLRERKSDIVILINYIINRNNILLHKKIKGIEKDALEALIKCDWPGNVRQLNNVIERMMLMAIRI